MLLFFVSFTVLFLQACSKPVADSFQLSGLTMGTSYHITVVELDQSGGTSTPTKPNKEALKSRIDTRLALLNQQMSTYIDDSELLTFNRAPAEQWVALSSELFDVLMLSFELGWLSNGAFDISVGPLVDLWGFGPTQDKDDYTRNPPDQGAIKTRLEQVGFRHLEFDIGKNQVRKRRQISLDLSAIAKGYAVDQIAQLLLAVGYQHFMVEIGGELRVQGNSPRSGPWRIAIEQPSGDFGDVNTAIAVSGVGIATSGDYRNYFEHDGKRYSHTIDPNTGAPVTHNLVSVTVIAETAAYADGLATAMTVMGKDAGMKLAQQHNLAVYFITKAEEGFSVSVTEAFKPYLVLNQ